MFFYVTAQFQETLSACVQSDPDDTPVEHGVKQDGGPVTKKKRFGIGNDFVLNDCASVFIIAQLAKTKSAS